MIQSVSSCWKTEAQHYLEETCDTEEFKAPSRAALEGANYQARKEYSVWGYSHSVCVHVCQSVRVYVCVCVHAEARGQHQISFSASFYITSEMG